MIPQGSEQFKMHFKDRPEAFTIDLTRFYEFSLVWSRYDICILFDDIIEMRMRYLLIKPFKLLIGY